MPPEDERDMRTSESRPLDNNTANHHRDGREYPLETLMALQKLLEGGIPEEATEMHQQSHQPLPASTRQAEPPRFCQSESRFSDTLRDWAAHLRSLFMRDRKSKTAGRGNSAQQRG